VEGTFGFSVALPAALEPSAGPPSPSPSHPGAAAGDRAGAWWPWLFGAAVLAIGAVVAVRFVRVKRS
jgi:hypothetical protein